MAEMYMPLVMSVYILDAGFGGCSPVGWARGLAVASMFDFMPLGGVTAGWLLGLCGISLWGVGVGLVTVCAWGVVGGGE